MLIALLIAAVQPPQIDPGIVTELRAWTFCLTAAAEERTVAGATAEAVADAALAACPREEDAMIAAHVARHGADSAVEGRATYRRGAGAYIADRTRLRLEAIAADPLAAANAAHGGCIGERVGIDAASTTRGAEAIVDEAIAACRPQERRLHAALAASRDRAYADAAIATLLRDTRTNSIALVAELRRRGAARR